MIRPAPRVAVLAAIVAGLWAAPSVRAGERAFLSLVINGVPEGEALVLVLPDDVFIDPEALSRTGLSLPRGRSESHGGRTWLSLGSLAPVVRFQIDEQEVALRLTVAIAAYPTTTRDMALTAPADIAYRRDSSGFLNYSLQLQDLTRLDGFAELGLSHQGALFTSTMLVSATHGFVPVRGLTSVTWDDRPGLKRYVIGDGFMSTGALGGGLIMGGLGVARSFELDPYFHRQPMLGYAGAVSTPSTLEVYVNGSLVRREALPPGPFQLHNVPVTVGGGNVRYEVRDAFGHTTSVSAASYYLPAGLLARGVEDYAYTLGFRRDAVGSESFHYGDGGLLILGRHRRGFTDWLTAGMRFELGIDLLSGGASATLRLPRGEIEAAAGASLESGGAGIAGMLSYAYVSRAFSVGAHATLVSDHYATASTHARDNRAVLDLAAFASVPVGSRVTLSAQYARLHMRDSGPQELISASANARLADGLSLLVSASRTGAPDGSHGVELSAMLNFALGGSRSGGAGYRQHDETGQALVQLQKPLPIGTGVGYRFQGAAGSAMAASGLVEAQTAFGRYFASYDLAGGHQHSTLGAAGSLVGVLGAGVFASRPIESGFAVVQVPGVRGVRALLNNQDVGRTDRRGNVVVPNLLAYYGNRIGITDGDVPLDHSIEGGEQKIAPPSRGGVRVVFAVHRSRFVRGRLRVRGATGLAIPGFGELSLQDGTVSVSSPVGDGGEFEISDASSGSHAARVQWRAGRCDFTLTIPAEEKTVIDLGQIECPQQDTAK